MQPDRSSPPTPLGGAPSLSRELNAPAGATALPSVADAVAAGNARWQPVLIITASVFLGEALVMVVLHWTQATAPLVWLLDALLVAALSFVLLQRFVVRPLQQSNDRLQAEIAERRRVEETLRIQTTALHAAAHGVMISDRSGRIRWVNPAMVAITGYSEAELLGQTPSLLKSGCHDGDFYRRLWQTILAGEVWTGEIINRRKDGILYTEDQTITPVRDAAGQVTHFIAVKADCTARKQAEAELAQRNAALLALSQTERRQRQFAEALVQASRVLNSSLVLEEVLDCILEQTQQMLPCRAAAVMLLRGDWVEVPRQRDATGATHDLAQGFPLNRFPELRALAARHTPHYIANTADEVDWAVIPGLEWIRSLILAPLIEYNRVTGFLGVFSDQEAYFEPEDISCLVAFAAHAAVALRNARLYRAELYARRTAETLSDASLDLTRTLELHAVLDSLLRHLHQLVAYDGAHLALMDDSGYFTVEAAAGDDPWATDSHMLEGPAAVLDLADAPTLHSLVIEQQSVMLHDRQPALRSTYFDALAPMRSWLGVPIVVGNHAVGFCALEKREPAFFTTEHMRLTEVMVAQAAVAIQNAALFQEVQSGHKQLQMLSRRLVQVQENERRHVARELHDEAGQALTTLRLRLRHLSRHAGSPEAVVEAVNELCGMTDTVLANLHRLAMDLRPASLDHLGLVVALRDQVATLDRQHMVEGRFDAIGFGQERLPADLETALYRIAQEALTNVVRHAHANHVELLLHLYPDKVRMTIEDDGVGFDPSTITTPNRLGLLGMRERCEALGGKFVIETAPGCGTTLVAELPHNDSHPDCR